MRQPKEKRIELLHMTKRGLDAIDKYAQLLITL
jgi:hypothetical protein